MNVPFDFRAILQQVEGAAPPEGLPDWLRRSWAEPDTFAAGLAPAHAGRGAPFKSRTGQHHDFFHDLLVRHAATDRIALRTYDRAGGWKSLSYRQLHEQAARRAAVWAQRGVKPGAKVCLVLHPGPELLVCLGAALGLGACVSFLPPVGRRFVSRRLAALAPQHVAAEPHQSPLLGPFAPMLLPTAGPTAAPLASSHTYKPDEAVGLLFSPRVDPPSVPLPLKASDAWLGALVDGLLTFALAPGDALAAPGFHALQHLPALLFTTLLRGATYVHLEPADVEERPALLTEHPLRALGVTPALRDVLTRAGTSLKGVGGWFRDAEAPLDWQAWREWVKRCGLAAVPHTNVLVDATAGGAVLTSPRRVGDVHSEAPPAPGRRWTLKDFNRSGQQAPGDSGLFTLLPPEGRPPGHVVLSRVRQQYHYGGTREPRHEGRVLPAAEITEALDGLPCATSLLTVPTGGLSGELRSVLLVFTGAPGAAAPAPSLEDIRRRIELQLGAEFIPERFEVFPLYPRLKEGRVNDAWCHAQYVMGSLYHKAEDPLFQTLTELRAQVRQESAPAEVKPAAPPPMAKVIPLVPKGVRHG